MAPIRPQTAPFGSWKSPITSSRIAEQSIGLSEPIIDGGDIYWLEQRPKQNRCAIVRRSETGNVEDVLPASCSARTRVHEYGGSAWTVSDGMVCFSNDRGEPGHKPDRRLYRLDRGAASPVALTPIGPPDTEWRYADGTIDRRRQRWIGVREQHTRAGSGPAGVRETRVENTIVAVSLEGGEPDPGAVLVSGHDFFSSPRLSPDGRWMAWLAWDHPNMPWVGTTLHLGEIERDGRPARPAAIAGGAAESIFQPQWSADGSALFFVSDRTGWWNLYRYDVARKTIHTVAPRQAEFGQAQWLFGMSTYGFARDRIVAAYRHEGTGRLALIDLASNDVVDIELPFTEYSYVRTDGSDRVVFRGGGPDTPPAIVRLDVGATSHRILKQSIELTGEPALAGYFSPARPIAFPTTGGKTAFALFYPPHNPDYAPPAAEKPPLLVKCHGGPTSAATGTLDLRIQYWTSRGIAVLDVNYGGSTGYGREYRNRLHRQWGIVDVDDCVNGADFLARQGLVDRDRCVITGGSAGGYTTLAALAFRDFFQGGASYYGVSDTTALARTTHKFESRYLDWLIGQYPDEEALYRERSPLFHADRIARPVIFFQGDEDAIVPPEQTEKMVAALRARNIPVGFLLLAGEQHGFRQAANIQRTLDAELYFYATEVFKSGLRF
jgi:dipeptidyl aminopeptidase/acylaminoacyl peptidase